MITSLNAKLDAVPDVVIDGSGRFKYILIEVIAGDATKYIVRGHKRAEFHADIFSEVEPSLSALGLKCECLGGGRIDHNLEEKKILVYGYSVGFGMADHSITVKKLREHYPDYVSISYTNEGY